MADNVTKTVVGGTEGAAVFRTVHGIVAKKADGDTVPLPPHVAAFFEDKGLVS